MIRIIPLQIIMKAAPTRHQEWKFHYSTFRNALSLIFLSAGVVRREQLANINFQFFRYPF